MRMLPPLGELRAFEAAARHLSFRRAATELGVTPTAVSHQIRRLEAHCGQPLFRRRPRPLALTQAGQRLLPGIRDGLDGFAEAVASVRVGGAGGRLRITTTTAFAARWLVPRLPQLRRLHPRLRLEILGTDAVVNVRTGEADIAIRYSDAPPADLTSFELLRDRFHVVGAPALVGQITRPLTPGRLRAFPLIEYDWPPDDPRAPTWGRWETAARTVHRRVPSFVGAAALGFREESHAIDAVLAGQGLALCSDVLVGSELADGTLVRVSGVTLPGYGFHLAHRPDHPGTAAMRAFVAWARSMT